MKKKWLIAAVCVLMLVLTACSGGGQGGMTRAPGEMINAPTETTEPAPQLWEANVLRSDVPNGDSYSVSWIMGSGGFGLADDCPCFVFGSEYGREQVRSIHFLDTLRNVPGGAWDVSEAGDGSVLAWVEPNGELYDLFIGAEGGIKAPEDCTMLFFG